MRVSDIVFMVVATWEFPRPLECVSFQTPEAKVHSWDTRSSTTNCMSILASLCFVSYQASHSGKQWRKEAFWSSCTFYSLSKQEKIDTGITYLLLSPTSANREKGNDQRLWPEGTWQMLCSSVHICHSPWNPSSFIFPKASQVLSK